jgi:mannosyltransferase
MMRGLALFTRHPGATLAWIVLVGAALRWWRIDYQSFWFDEAVSATIARQPLWEILTGSTRDVGNPPFFHLLLSFWRRAAGDGDAAIRGLSVLCGIASLPAMYWLGKKTLGVSTGLVAAALLALSPFHVYYSQEARTYCLVVLLSLLSTIAMIRCLEKPASIGRWTAYVLVSFLGIYSHYFVGCLIVGQNLFAFVTRRTDRRLLLKWAGAQVCIGLLYIAWLPTLIEQLLLKGNLSRYGDTWYIHLAATPVVFSVGRTLVWKGNAQPALMAVAVLGTLACAAAFVAGLISMWKRPVPMRGLIVLSVLAPVVLPGLVSLFLFPMYSVQYVIPALPAWCLIVAAGIVSMSGVTRRVVSGTIVAAVSIALVYQGNHLYKHDWKRSVPFVEQNMQAGDIVMFDADFNELPYARYAHRSNGRYRLYLADGQPDGEMRAVPPGGRLTEDVSGAVRGHERIWLVLSDVGLGSDGYYERQFNANWTCTQTARFQGIEVRLYVRR